MASGAPTVAADIGCFREIAGDAAFYADPHKTEALATAIESALFTPRARAMLIKRGRECVRRSAGMPTARNLRALFDDVLAERATSDPATLRPHFAEPVCGSAALERFRILFVGELDARTSRRRAPRRARRARLPGRVDRSLESCRAVEWVDALTYRTLLTPEVFALNREIARRAPRVSGPTCSGSRRDVYVFPRTLRRLRRDPRAAARLPQHRRLAAQGWLHQLHWRFLRPDAREYDLHVDVEPLERRRVPRGRLRARRAHGAGIESALRDPVRSRQPSASRSAGRSGSSATGSP
jgi:hypothetical protein